jgi:hypothetical protein
MADYRSAGSIIAPGYATGDYSAILVLPDQDAVVAGAQPRLAET